MGTETPDVWARTVEISFGNTEVTRHDFYECFEHSGDVEASAFDAISRLQGRALCIFRIGFKTVVGHDAFMAKYGEKESVVIGNREVRINVRDRSINLIRVRIQHFKFDDDLNQLARRLRDYGSVSRIFWDTYQDRSLPKWNGIKTGVVNVDMEIRKNIPSYINFGNYKHPLMVSYGGQMPTCRMCESPTHVLANCPKLANKVAIPSMNNKGPFGTRTYSSVLTKPTLNKATISGGGEAEMSSQPAPQLDVQAFPVLAKRSAALKTAMMIPVRNRRAEQLSRQEKRKQPSHGNTVTNKNNQKKEEAEELTLI
ncbi:hypothetical protein GHT06_001746 [Daphnia sinensis]|uniref:Uncharacterized protein n=1 Tax=Daphnia sinensis TaxID=1820382 RepID=A0AAD5PML7_9CRUS|nr:hypothetical protein GHT06_001746 [Daphnia sinensis]